MESIEDLFKLLYEIRKNPALYFGGKKNLAHLANFIYGFLLGRKGTNKEIAGGTDWFGDYSNGFQAFIVKKYKIDVSQSWYNIIEFHVDSEDEAFNLFFKLLDEFMENKLISETN